MTDIDCSDEVREWYALDNPDGAELLDDIDDYLARFVVYPSEHERRAHTLWIAHTWLMDCWESTPRIAFLSPEPGSGKSRALEVTEPLVPRPVHAVNTTSAYLFRKVSDPDGPPTILYDEIDTVFGPKARDNEDIRGMLNAGHRKGAVAGRCVVRGKNIETEELDAYCAVALAGLDDLPDTLMSRSIICRMRRRAPSEPVEPWRLRVNAPEAEKLHHRLAQWSRQVTDQVTDKWPEMPPSVTDRAADVWEPLIIIADQAGGHWPDTARVTAVTLATASRKGTLTLGVQLLSDIRSLFDTHKSVTLSTDSLLTDLREIEESPWSVINKGEAINSRGLASRLSKYGIEPKLHKVDGKGFRGYARAQFEDAWSRYVPTESVTSVTSVTPQVSPAETVPLLPPASVTSVTPQVDEDQPDLDLFDLTPTANGCACGNALVTASAIWSGKCKPCRDREEAA
jgi:Protein of unknown function (DUF3631)